MQQTCKPDSVPRPESRDFCHLSLRSTPPVKTQHVSHNKAGNLASHRMPAGNRDIRDLAARKTNSP